MTIRDLVTVLKTGESGSVEYMRELSRTEAAAPLAEGIALTGTSGTKPEGALTFEKTTVPVRTIAEWLPVTSRILSDAPGLREYVGPLPSWRRRTEP
jgi:HK97 family phage major capsid protein